MRPAPMSMANIGFRLGELLNVFNYCRSALRLARRTSPRLTACLLVLTIATGALPAAIAYLAKLLLDAVLLAMETGQLADRHQALMIVALEAVVVALLAGLQRALSTCESLLRALLSQRVQTMILEKALQLSLRHFEDPRIHDLLTLTRERASTRPLSLVTRSLGLSQNVISLILFALLLSGFSPWAVALLLLAGLPLFAVEMAFSGEAFRMFKWQCEETRVRTYLEWVLSNDSAVKEIRVFKLGPLLLGRFNAIFEKLYQEDRSLALRRALWGILLGLFSLSGLYLAYFWVISAAVAGSITLGAMAMYLLLFKQGQAAVTASLSAIGSMYEDNLYLSSLEELLAEPVDEQRGTATVGSKPGEGVRFEGVHFRYPGATRDAVEDVTLHLKPGQKLGLVGENGSGKSTLIKLLARLYAPTRGRITLDGTSLEEWKVEALRTRMAVIFQDFIQFQLPLGENIGAGHAAHFLDRKRWEDAARKGLAEAFIDRLPRGYDTQLGKWFSQGHELSGGQWQSIALSRAFMSSEADILVLDEPTSALDAEAETRLFEHIHRASADRMAILISHRFSTVRMADTIVVMESGRVAEQGSHEELLGRAGGYARLFQLQSAGYS